MRAQAVKEGVSAVEHPAQHILARADFDRDKPAGGQHIGGAEVYLSGASPPLSRLARPGRRPSPTGLPAPFDLPGRVLLLHPHGVQELPVGR